MICSILIINQDDMTSHLLKAKARQPRQIFWHCGEADVRARNVHIGRQNGVLILK